MSQATYTIEISRWSFVRYCARLAWLYRRNPRAVLACVKVAVFFLAGRA